MGFLSKIISIVLAALLLIGTIGIAEFNSRCPYSGLTDTQYLFYSCCCGEDGNGCCDLQVEFHEYKADCFSQFAKPFAKIQPINVDAILAEWTFEIENLENYRPKEVHVIYDPPLKHKSGKSILILYETFLI